MHHLNHHHHHQASRVVLSLVVLCCLTASVSYGEQDQFSRAQLISHSIETPYSKNLQDDWMLVGAAMGAFDHLIVIPGIAEMKGQFWNRKPLLTDTFDVEYTLEINAGPGVAGVEPQPEPRSHGLAMWYLEGLPEGVNSSTTIMDDSTLFGMRPIFKGLGVFFAIFDRENKVNHSVSAVVSDGIKVWNPVADIPTNGGVYWRIREVGPLEVAISVGPEQITGKARTAGNMKWTPLFSIPGGVQSGGFLGFSGDSGSRGAIGSPGERMSDKIMIRNLKVFNRNLAMPGEERSENVQNMVRELNSMASKTDTSEQLKELSHVLTKLVVEILPRQDDIAHTLNVMDSRLNRLSSDVSYLLQRVDKVQNKVNEAASGDTHKEIYRSVSDEIQGLKEMFQSHAQVAESIMEVKNVVESHRPGHKRQLDSINDALKAQVKTSWMMFIILIVVVVCVVGFVWKKSRDLEKKHLF